MTRRGSPDGAPYHRGFKGSLPLTLLYIVMAIPIDVPDTMGETSSQGRRRMNRLAAQAGSLSSLFVRNPTHEALIDNLQLDSRCSSYHWQPHLPRSFASNGPYRIFSLPGFHTSAPPYTFWSIPAQRDQYIAHRRMDHPLSSSTHRRRRDVGYIPPNHLIALHNSHHCHSSLYYGFTYLSSRHHPPLSPSTTPTQ